MNTTAGLEAEDFDTLDNILDDLRERFDETPQWEFCEGFMAALVCSRRAIPVDEWLPMLLGIDPDEAEGGSFADAAQREQFLALWQRRFDEVRLALDTPVEALDDDKAYAPEVMDVRGAIASLPPEEREEIDDSEIPAFAQVWALGHPQRQRCRQVARLVVGSHRGLDRRRCGRAHLVGLVRRRPTQREREQTERLW